MMQKHSLKLVLSLTSALTVAAATANADQMPAEKSLSGLEFTLIGRDDIYGYGSLDAYQQALMLDALVESGAFPPVAERLPAEPIIFQSGAMVDGVGEYGGFFRHVIGGRPEGWNWMAGQHQGWGGINMAMQECLVRQGPAGRSKPRNRPARFQTLRKAGAGMLITQS